MGNQQHTAPPAVPYVPDQAVEVGLSGKINALGRFIQDQQVGFTQQGPGQKNALQFAAGQVLERLLAHPFRPDFLEHGADVQAPATAGDSHGQETVNGQRHGAVQGKALGHVADPQARAAVDTPPAGMEQSEHGPDQGGLAGAIGANQGNHFAGADVRLADGKN